MKLAGIILIVIGVLALVYQGFTYTMTKKDAQLGPIVIQHDETHSVPLPPIVGAVCIVGGVAALAIGALGKM
jgi:drug/metabolite transporter (DMT)-like permease